MKRGMIFVFFLAVFILPISSASFIIGEVQDSLSGDFADGKTIVLWRTAGGLSDNATDIIGASGNSGVSGYYMIDCFNMLNTPCAVGDEVRVKIFNNGDNYVTEEASLIVSGLGFDVMASLRVNSIPNVSLVLPVNNSIFNYSSINLSCLASDLDSNLAEISLYGNWSGGWHLNQTSTVSGSSYQSNFTKTFLDGVYSWSCSVEDNLSISSFAQNNFSFFIDTVPPQVSVSPNVSSVCFPPEQIRVNCVVLDSLTGVAEVNITAIMPSGNQTNIANFLSGNNYYSDFLVNETGYWGFECRAIDFAGNVNFSIYNDFRVGIGISDLFVSSDDIYFSNYNPQEGEQVIIYANISNIGCSDAENFSIGFFKGNPLFGGISLGNFSLSLLEGYQNYLFNVSWAAEVGPSEIYVYADFLNNVSEVNESNNLAFQLFELTGWQYFYGDAFLQTILADQGLANVSSWYNSSYSWNIFIVDSEAQVNWSSLQAFGRAINGSQTQNDFSELDLILNMTNFSDSVSNVFTSNGNDPVALTEFVINSVTIPNVPIVNSTNNSNFITGILWDYSTDNDGEFDVSDREEILFVTKLNPLSAGAYGVYDYEIRIPVRLREYHNSDVNEVYIYFDIN